MGWAQLGLAMTKLCDRLTIPGGFYIRHRNPEDTNKTKSKRENVKMKRIILGLARLTTVAVMAAVTSIGAVAADKKQTSL